MCINVHFFLIGLIIYFYAVHKLDLFILFYLFIVGHELAHIFVALMLNISVLEINLLPVGVFAKFNYLENRKKELIIAAAGPLFSILIAIISNDSLLSRINIIISFLNLIPIYPLDGGRILRCIFELLFGYRKSIIFCNKISQVLLIIMSIFGIVLLVYFRNNSLIFLDIYIYWLAKEEIKKERVIRTINKILGD